MPWGVSILQLDERRVDESHHIVYGWPKDTSAPVPITKNAGARTVLVSFVKCYWSLSKISTEACQTDMQPCNLLYAQGEIYVYVGGQYVQISTKSYVFKRSQEFSKRLSLLASFKAKQQYVMMVYLLLL
eukprot:scaffold2093_cov141-Alexandrium_tamarense.AAC.2